ncbi:MAG: sodium:solute symporter family protein [Thermoplasmata archaeon]|nr:sodium:solute symporter family protein [Thermoplasmata archaeon]
MYFLVALTIYIILMLSAGIYGARKGKGLSHFFVADRKLGLISTSSTTAATTIGGSATIVSVAMVYSYGLTGIWIDLAGGLGLIVLGLFLARKVRALGVYSLPELVEHFYNREARVAASALVILAEIAWVALLIQALRFILTATTDLNPEHALLLSAIIFVAYTVLGGQCAVAYSDVIQLLIMIIGIVFIAAPLALMEAGGWDALTSHSSDKLSFPVSDGMPLKDVIPLFLLMFLPHVVGSDIYSKVLSARDPQTAGRAMLIAGGLKILFGVMMVIIGLSALVLFPELDAPAMALPKIIEDVLPWWAAGIVLVAFAGVMMSSADSCLLTGSTTFTNDLYRFAKKGATEKEMVIVARGMVVVLGVLSYLIAVRISDIIDTLRLGYTIFASSIIIPVILGFFKDRLRVPSMGAIAGMVAGGIVSIVWMYGVKEWYPSLFNDIDPIIAGMTACAGALFITTVCHRSSLKIPDI